MAASFDAGEMLMSSGASALFAGGHYYVLSKVPSSFGGITPYQGIVLFGAPVAAAAIGSWMKYSSNNVSAAFGDGFFHSGMSTLGWTLTTIFLR